MKACLLLALLLPSVVLAQGTVQGHAVNAANPEALLADPARVCAVYLPATSHPFCEITSATWQEAMSALAENRAVTTPFGKLEGGVTPTGMLAADLAGDGSFHLEGLPLETRIGLAVKVDGIWWPLREEVWLTADKPSQDVRINYCRLGAESPVLESHRLQAAPLLRQDLKYGGIPLIETLRLTNTDPARGALVEIVLDLAMVPGTVARHLPQVYGSHLLFLQGWNLSEPVKADRSADSRAAWMLGGATMHGSAPTYGKGAQTSPDNWHPLQQDGLIAICGAGDTLFRENPSPDGRSASLVFRRVVPPTRGGTPGTLEIRIIHQAGARTAEPGQRSRLLRTFPLALRASTADIAEGITLQGLVTESHRKFYGEPVADGRNARFTSARSPALEANEQLELILGFNTEAQAELADMEARATGQPTAEPGPAPAAETQGLNTRALFLALAAMFGLAFLIALVASVRKPREQQLERLNKLPMTRDELLQALRDLEADYKQVKLPATAYLEQKQRLMNRLIEVDAGGS